ncbi:MAG: hypothetical protein K0R57_1434 [Paenibacillaceae bacterium]|nr:hypothetical protein [Paenibacillaceae bacterium]
MVDFHLPIRNNPLRTKKDLQDAFLQITEPLKKFYSPGYAQLRIGHTGASYPENVAFLEGFSRVLWGLAPFLLGGGDSGLEQNYLAGIKNGTNPEHPEYWGNAHAGDIRMVEMAAVGFAIALVPDKLWQPLNDHERDNLTYGLNGINRHEPYHNNWQFFRVMVDMGLAVAGREYDRVLLQKSLDTLDSFYYGEGWYGDGRNAQFDYYIAFAMHFYGLIYGKAAGEHKYLERARLFAKDFIHWFSSEGDALPFGRSLTYRFAQTAFWSAYVYAGGGDEDLGVVKGIILRHLRWWFNKPVFDRDGILSIGYGYPNLIMSEGYNAPGSPYWALKSFLVLALPDDHAFWLAEEKPFPLLNPLSVQKHPKMIIQHMEENRHVVALTSGQYADFNPVHNEAKYSKFAYSNIFGFSVSRSNRTVEQGAFDSMLALSEDGRAYRVRQNCEQVEMRGNSIISTWRPWEDVVIKTVLIPLGAYHIRIHQIQTSRRLVTAECGFSAAWGDEIKQLEKLETKNSVCALYPWSCSGIIDLNGNRKARLQVTEPNTNLLHPRAVMPVLEGDVQIGETVMACAVLGVIDKEYCKKSWLEQPVLLESEGAIRLHYKGETREINEWL